MKRIIILSLILLIGVGATAYYYFEKLNNANQQNEMALHTALQSSFLTLSFNNDPTFFEVLKDYPLFDQLLGEDKKNELLAIKQLIIKNNNINKRIANRKIFVSLVPDGKSTFDLLYIAQLNQTAEINSLLKEMNTGGTKVSIIDEQLKIEGQLGEEFYGMIRNNTAIISKNSNLVRMIANNKLNSIQNEMEAFLSNDRNISKKGLSQLYINTQKTESLYQTLFVNKAGTLLDELSNSQALAVLDFNYGSNKLQFSGTSLFTQKDCYFQSFIEQKAQKISIPQLLPTSTANYSIYTISNFLLWQQNLEKYLSKKTQLIKRRNNVLEKIQQTDSISAIQSFADLKTHEFAYIELNTGEKIGVLKCDNLKTLQNNTFKKLIQNSNDSVFRWKYKTLLPAIYGDVFSDFQHPYLKIEGNYLLIANTISTLNSIKNIQQKPEKLLINSENYKDFSSHIIPEANISYFINNMEDKSILRKQIRWDLFQYYIPDKSPYRKIYGMGIQLSAEDNFFQSTVTITNRVDRSDFD